MYQKIIIIGNLGRDPEMRYMPDGTAVTNLSVATNRRWNNRNTGESVNETTWFRVSVWRRQAEIANQYLSKGSKVLVEGRLTVDSETGGPRVYTRQDGSVGASFEITADNIQFLSSRAEDEAAAAGGGSFSSAPNGGGGGSVQEEDDIPF